ncbi:MAG: hypothetical protein AAGJ40_07185 [Planctomycetota bacterium]
MSLWILVPEIGVGALLALSMEFATQRWRCGEARLSALMRWILTWCQPAVAVLIGLGIWSWWSPDSSWMDHAFILGGMVATLVAARFGLELLLGPAIDPESGDGASPSMNEPARSAGNRFSIGDLMSWTLLIASVITFIRRSPWAMDASTTAGRCSAILWCGMGIAWATLPIAWALIQRSRRARGRWHVALAVLISMSGMSTLAILDAMVIQPERLDLAQAWSRYACIGLGMLLVGMAMSPVATSMAHRTLKAVVRWRQDFRPFDSGGIRIARFDEDPAERGPVKHGFGETSQSQEPLAPTYSIDEFRRRARELRDPFGKASDPPVGPRLAANTSMRTDSEPVDYLA